MTTATYAAYPKEAPPRERIAWCTHAIALLSRRISACQQRRANLIARREHVRAEMKPLTPEDGPMEVYDYADE